MYLDGKISKTVDLLRIASLVLVLYLHAFNDTRLEGHARYWAELTSRRIGALGVPAFFLVSGFLLGIRGNLSAKEISSYQARRVLQLSMTFIFWNGALAVVVLLAFKIGILKQGFLLEAASGGLSSIFGITKQYPIDYPFWFIGNLIVFNSFVACVYSRGVERVAWSIVAVALLLAFCVPLPSRSLISAAYFLIGILLAPRMATIISNLRITSWIGILVVTGLIVISWLIVEGGEEGWKLNIFLPFGIIFLVSTCRLAGEKLHFQSLRRLSGATFFLFAAHEPLLTFIKLVLLKVANAETSYILSPLIVIGITASVFYLTKKNVRQKFWWIFSGSKR